MGGDEPFERAHAVEEIQRLARLARHVQWMTPRGSVVELTVPPTVYPPREDTTLLASVLTGKRLSSGTQWLEIGCGSGALSLFAAELGCTITACDVNPMAVACTRKHLEAAGVKADVLEGGPGPSDDGGLAQWGGDRLYDVVVWNTPYLASSSLADGALGPMEEAAFTDTDSKGLHVRFLDLLSEGRLLKEQGIAYITVSSSGFAEQTPTEAWRRGLAARTVASTRFDDGEVLSVLALWRPYTGSPIHSVATTESTNDDVLAFSSKPGASVRAEQQTEGRGRHGRRWLNQESAMMASWLVEDGRSWVHSTMDQLRVGEALVRLLKGWSACDENDVCLKWPNDVYIRTANGGMAKAGGVLFEAVSQGRKHRLVLGIGVNTRPSSEGDFSGLDDLGLEVDAAKLHSAVHAVVASLFESLAGLSPSRVDSVRIEASVKHGILTLGEPLYRGMNLVVNGLDEAGALIVEGSEQTMDDPELLSWSIL
jgi:biotin-(acetyl-CoA carboxylase) ligase/methylase of polypeptide subunit release factors